jgi:hypothetical protein
MSEKQKRRGVVSTYCYRGNDQEAYRQTSTNDPRPKWDESARLILCRLKKIGRISVARIRDESQISMRPTPQGAGLCHSEIYKYAE